MTTATAVPCPNARSRVRPAGLNRLALVVGLALVSWGRRSSNTAVPTRDELHARALAEREAHQLRADYAASKMLHGLIR